MNEKQREQLKFHAEQCLTRAQADVPEAEALEHLRTAALLLIALQLETIGKIEGSPKRRNI